MNTTTTAPWIFFSLLFLLSRRRERLSQSSRSTHSTWIGDSHSSLFTSSPHRALHEERHDASPLLLSYSLTLALCEHSPVLFPRPNASRSLRYPGPHHPSADPVPGKPSSSGLDSKPTGPGLHSTRSTMLKLMFHECSLTGPGFWLPCCCYSVGAFS